MPSRRKSNKQAKKTKHLTANTQPIHHSSPAVQFYGKGDLKILREQNGRCGNANDSLRPSSEKCVCLVVEEEKGKKKGFPVSVSLSAGCKQMEGSFDERLDLQETQKVEESQSEVKEVIVADAEEVKSIVESGGEVAAETQDGEDSNFVIQNEETSVLVDSENVEETKEASEPILSTPNDFIDATKQPDDAESKLKENQEKDLAIPEKTDEGVEEKELNNEISSGLANTLNSRETEEAVETTEADENKLASSEEKNELSSVARNEVLENSSDFSVPPTDVVPKAIEETTIVKPDESEESLPKGTEESKLLGEDEKVGELSSVVQESSKEQDANESLQPSKNLADAETSTVQDKTEIPRSTESENQTTVSGAQQQYTSWRSCCGLFEFLSHGDR